MLRMAKSMLHIGMVKLGFQWSCMTMPVVMASKLSRFVQVRQNVKSVVDAICSHCVLPTHAKTRLVYELDRQF